MAGEINGVSKTGLGFFTKEGQLKSSEQLSKEGAASAPEQAGNATETSFSSTSISQSISSVRNEFRADANKVASAINQDDAILKQAQAVVKEQLAAAKELKTAIKEGDSQQADKQRKKLIELEQKRAEISKVADERNQATIDSRVQGIRIGNSTLQVVKREEIKVKSTTDSSELEKKKDINQFINELQSEKESIAAQRKQLKEDRQLVKETVKRGETQLDRIEERSIRSFDEAARTAGKISSQIRSGSQEAFAFNVKEDVVRRLLA